MASSSYPTAETHEVVGRIRLPMDVTTVVKLTRAFRREYPDAVVIYAGPLATPNELVIGIKKRV